ncbi:hypothetical protein [Saccharothrix sp. Mg75]|uniref:hypothetical protein n=1 Tax=Saccharothrix sp. Mg75 TaxID=3445357 RepID=UPI003EEB733A
MGEREGLPGALKRGWAAVVAVCAVGLTSLVALVSDLAQLDSWISTGGAPVIRVSCYLVLFAAGWVLWREKFRRTGRAITAAAVALACVGAVVAAPWLWPTPAVAPGATPSGATPPDPVLTKDGYRLTPSSSPLTNHADKIDLDTGCPGWGPTGLRAGRSRCGDVADLIVETYGVHAPEDAPRLSVVDGGASYPVCRGRTDGVGTVRLSDLRAGTELCVSTDKDNLAAVRVDSVGDGGEVVISYRLWRA